MKTEPTEALRLIEYSWYALPNATAIDRKDCIEAVNIAFKEGQSNPKIKQLEWDVHGPMHYVNQYNPIGYTACITEWSFGEKPYSVRLGLNDSNNSTKFFYSIDEAKDFVQKDFEKRVKECLIIE